MSESGLEPFSSANEVLDSTELSDIAYTQLSANRSDEDSDSALSVKVAARLSDERIEIMGSGRLAGQGAVYVVDVIAQFTKSDAREIPEDMLRDFVERVGVITIYPYIREGIVGLAAKLALPRPRIPLFRPGRVKLSK
jgi:hypothetical protein